VVKFAQACITLLANEEKLEQYRHDARRLAEKYSWDNNFDRGLSYL
jgi:glycosyltransferase involved in cell wall biosynthesis